MMEKKPQKRKSIRDLLNLMVEDDDDQDFYGIASFLSSQISKYKKNSLSLVLKDPPPLTHHAAYLYSLVVTMLRVKCILRSVWRYQR